MMQGCGNPTKYNPWRSLQLQNHLNWLHASEDPELNARKNVLRDIGRALDAAGILWALSCSAAGYAVGLFQRRFGDYDLLVNPEDFELSKDVLAKAGVTMFPTTQKKEFASPYYQVAEKDGIQIELIALFWVAWKDVNYCYNLQEEDIITFVWDGIKIPALAVEVQMVLYGSMIAWQEEREVKMRICFEYLKTNGVERTEYLQEVLEKKLVPCALKEAIRELLSAN